MQTESQAMSDKPIQVGDLVVMVRGHECGMKIASGIPFVVTALLRPIGGGWHCDHCNTDSAGPNEVAAEGFSKKGRGLPLSWLKRIPPLDELEFEQRKEEIEA